MREPELRASGWCRLPLTGSALLLAACVGVPDPPPLAEDLSALNEQYEHPTALIPDDLIQQLFDAARDTLGGEAVLAGLNFTRDHISETSVGLAGHTNVEQLNLQGRVRASFDCPGDVATQGPGIGPGRVNALFGVVSSHLRRGFTGSIQGCRFPVVTTFGETQHVELSGEFSADIGADLAIGDPAPGSMLVHLINPRGSSTGPSFSLDLNRDEYGFRLTTDGALEILIEAIEIGPNDLGSLVAVLTAEGFLGLRDSRGQWTCGGEDQACVRIR